MGGEEITDDDKQWGMLAWLPIIGDIMSIIILLTEDRKNRPFQKYNAVLSLSLRMVGYVASGVVGWIIPCLGNTILFVALMVYLVILMLKAKEGEWVEIPFITDFCKNQGWI